MIINGINLPDIDIADADVAETYENAMDIIKKSAHYNENDKRSQVIRRYCNGVFEAFDLIWGSGTAKKVFGSQTNMTICIKAMDDLVSQVNELEKANNSLLENIGNKYYNRAQRRNNKNNNNKKNKNRNYNNNPIPIDRR